MELKQLQYFRVVAETENITRAADALFVSQPALSRIIRRLEEDVGFALFSRRSSHIHLTEAGRVFLAGVSQALDTLDSSLLNSQQIAGVSRQALSVDSSFAMIHEDIIVRLHDKFPQTQIQFSVLPAKQSLERLVSGDADFALIPRQKFPPEIEWKPLMNEEMLILVMEDHPKYGKKYITLKELEQYGIVTDGVEYTPVEIEEAAAKYGIRLNILFSSNIRQQRDVFQKSSAGVQFVPAGTVYRNHEYMSRILTPSPAISTSMVSPIRVIPSIFKRELGIAYTRNLPQSIVRKSFMELVEDYFSDLQKQTDEYITREYGVIDSR